MVYFIEMKMTINGEAAMKRLGESIGALLKGGECLQLIGDVGAGKTTLTKGIASGLSITEVVQSPTFTINRSYDTPSGIRLMHYDFYRLADPGIMADELRESLEYDDTVVVIEWGDIVADIVPKDHITVTIASPDESVREVSIEGSGNTSERLLKGLEG